MKKEDIIKKLSEIASDEKSGWLEKAKKREANRDWLKNSAKIAIKILRELRSKNLTQIWLAEKLDVTPQYVNKIIKGQENLSLETISKIEKVLGVKLISIPSFESKIDHPVIFWHNVTKINRNQTQSIAKDTREYKTFCIYEPDDEILTA